MRQACKNLQTIDSLFLIEGDEDVGERLTTCLSRAGFVVDWFRNVADTRESLFSARSAYPSAIIAELRLPDGGTTDLLQEVRRFFPLTKVLIVSSSLTGDCAVELLRDGILAIPKPVSAAALLDLVTGLIGDSSDPHSETVLAYRPAGNQVESQLTLENALLEYVRCRRLSERQAKVLELYLGGDNDKEIASTLGCSEATVYEHWRRMSRKAGGQIKSDLVADFHRFCLPSR